jgi:hypothetical protein
VLQEQLGKRARVALADARFERRLVAVAGLS